MTKYPTSTFSELQALSKILRKSHGRKFKAVYRGENIEGKISCIETDNSSYLQNPFLCTNEKRMNGERTKEKLGFLYSYVINLSGSNLSNFKDFELEDKLTAEFLLKDNNMFIIQ